MQTAAAAAAAAASRRRDGLGGCGAPDLLAHPFECAPGTADRTKRAVSRGGDEGPLSSGDKQPMFKGGDHVQDTDGAQGVVTGLDESCHAYHVRMLDGRDVVYREDRLVKVFKPDSHL